MSKVTWERIRDTFCASALAASTAALPSPRKRRRTRRMRSLPLTQPSLTALTASGGHARDRFVPCLLRVNGVDFAMSPIGPLALQQRTFCLAIDPLVLSRIQAPKVEHRIMHYELSDCALSTTAAGGSRRIFHRLRVIGAARGRWSRAARGAPGRRLPLSLEAKAANRRIPQ
jgi:hypothetical protein